MKRDLEKKLAKIPQNDKLKINVEEKLKTLQEEKNKDISNSKIKVSFHFFDRKVKEFNLGSADSSWYIDLLETLKLLTTITKKQLYGEYKKTFQPHPYDDIDKLNYKDDYLIHPQCEALQLRISKSKGRIHGFFVGDTFYIRFLDNDHNMYNDKRYGGVIYSEEPKSSYEILVDEKTELNERYNALLEKHDKNYEIMCSNCLECPKDVPNKFEF